MASTSPDDTLSLVLQQLTSISERLNTLESSRTNNTSSTITVSIPPVIPPTTHASARPLLQHGIRAEGLWRDKDFSISREPTKYSFRLESPKDYSIWSFSILRLLENDGLSPFVLGTAKQPSAPSQDSETKSDELWLFNRWLEFDSAAIKAILNSVSKAQLPLLTNCSSAYEMWARLKNTYLFNSEVTVARLESELINLTWKRNTSIDEYISQVDHACNLLRGCGQEIPDSRLKMTLLRGLPDRLSNVKHILLSQNPSSYYEMCDQLRAHVSLSMTYEQTSEKALNVSTRKDRPSKPEKPDSGPLPVCSTCKKSGHTTENCFKNLTPAQLADVKKNWICKLCSKKGHFAQDCELADSPADIPDEAENDASNLAITMMATDSYFQEDTTKWIVDSGCTVHMCNSLTSAKPESITKFEVPKTVYLADGKSLKAVGSGSVELKLKVSDSITIPVILKDVLFVPGLSKNLFSVSACMKQGVDVLFCFDTQLCLLKKNGTRVGVAQRLNGLWVLNTVSNPIVPNSDSNYTAHAMGVTLTPPVSQPAGNSASARAYVVSHTSMAAVPVQPIITHDTRRIFIRPRTQNCRSGAAPSDSSFCITNSVSDISRKNSRRSIISPNILEKRGSGDACMVPGNSETLTISPPIILQRAKTHVAVTNPFSILSDLSPDV